MDGLPEGYQSLGGDGYSSPGRRSYQPSTDLLDRPASLRHRWQRALLLLLSLLLVAVGVALAFLAFPRPLSCIRSATLPSIGCFTVDPVQRNLTSWAFTHTVTLINPNYLAPISVQSALVFFTLLPAANSSHTHSTPLPSPCPSTTVYPLGSAVVSPSPSRVSSLSTVDVSLSDRFNHTGDRVRSCLQRTCSGAAAYDLDVNGLLRVKWMQVESDLAMETVRVRVTCDRGGRDEEAGEGAAKQGEEEAEEMSERKSRSTA